MMNEIKSNEFCFPPKRHILQASVSARNKKPEELHYIFV
jgi:hypothetical protein